MKTTTHRAATGLLLLLLGTFALSSPAPVWDRRTSLTPARTEWFKNLAKPSCIDYCGSPLTLLFNIAMKFEPPCGRQLFHTSNGGGGSVDQEMIAGHTCLCTDRIYVSAILGCILRSCAKEGSANATANVGEWIQSWYGMCDMFADVKYPEPHSFVEGLCLKEKFEEKVGYPEMSGYEKVWGNGYLPDGTWPEAPKPTETLPSDKREQLNCTITVQKGSAGGMKTGTSSAVGIWLCILVAAGVATLAVVLRPRRASGGERSVAVWLLGKHSTVGKL